MDTIPHPLPAGQTVTDLYKAAIGQRNQDYYVTKFEDFDQHGAGMTVSWNWAAFLFTGVWALYRRMYGWFLLWWVVATILVVFEKSQNAQIHQTLAVVVGVLWLAFGAFADTLYHRKVRARIAAALKVSTDAARVTKRLRAGSGVHPWVPIVFGAIPVIGIVGAVALPAYQDYAGRRQATGNPYSVKDRPTGAYSSADLPVEPATAANPFAETQAIGSADRSGAPITAKLISPDDADAARARGDYATALRIWRARAEQGNANAQVNLGAMYYLGYGVAQDYAEAVKWNRLAASQGNLTAQSNLGAMYALGLGVAKDDVRAHMWLNLGATTGDGDAVDARNTWERLMTQQQIAQAQKMARECQQRNFKGCE